MQVLMPNPSLQTLLRLSAKAREAFEMLRRRSPAVTYQVERCDTIGAYRWKVVASGTTRTVAVRRTRQEALQVCNKLEGRAG